MHAVFDHIQTGLHDKDAKKGKEHVCGVAQVTCIKSYALLSSIFMCMNVTSVIPIPFCHLSEEVITLYLLK
jgi:hypothetical protein